MDILCRAQFDDQRAYRILEVLVRDLSGYPTTQELARFLLDSLNSGKLPLHVRFFAKST